MGSQSKKVLAPDEILRDLLRLDGGLGLEPYWGERSIFYNPGRVAPLGTIFASIKEHDGPNDRSSQLDRDGVFRFAFGMDPHTYEQRFGAAPARPPKGGVVELPGYDPTRRGELMPHPVYAWMGWVQILAPTAAQFESLRAPLGEALDLVRAKWQRRAGT